MARAHAIPTNEVTTAHLGFALTHDVFTRDGQLLLPKGTVLDTAALDRWIDLAPGEVHLIELGANDLHEDEAGLKVARAITGSGLRVAEPSQSRCDILAANKGLLRVDPELLRTINGVRDVTVYTMLDRQSIAEDTVVASVKITPIAIAEERVIAVERLCQQVAHPLLQVLPFQARRVGVLARDDVKPDMRTRFESAIERRLKWYGSELIDIRYVPADSTQIATVFRSLLEDGADLLLTAGGNTIDPLDPIEQALPLIDARLIHRGAPTRGSMFWLAQLGDVPIINLASCRMYIGTALADLILPMYMAGEQVTPDDIMALGYGGLPGSAISLRFPPYDHD